MTPFIPSTYSITWPRAAQHTQLTSQSIPLSRLYAAPSLFIFCWRLKAHLFSLYYPTLWLFPHLYSLFLTHYI